MLWHIAVTLDYGQGCLAEHDYHAVAENGAEAIDDVRTQLLKSLTAPHRVRIECHATWIPSPALINAEVVTEESS